MRRKNEPLNQVKKFKTISECLMSLDSSELQKTAVTFFDENDEKISRTYGKLREDIYACMDSFAARNLAGKHVAIVSENRYEWIVVFFAVVCMGGIVVTIDVEQTAEDIHKMICHADAACTAVSELFAPVVQEIPGHENRIVFGREEQSVTFSQLLEEGAEGNNREMVQEYMDKVTPETEAVIVYTSGTTSTAKPVVLAHENLMYCACNAFAMVTVGESLYTPLPFYHAYALVCGMLASFSQRIHFCANSALKKMMRELREFAPETVLGVPMIADNLLKVIAMEEKKMGIQEQIREERKHYHTKRRLHLPVKSQKKDYVGGILGSNIQTFISGGAHLNARTVEEFAFYGINVLQGYGISECSPLISTNRNNSNREGSVGHVLPGMEIRFCSGEILVKGPSVFKGYYKEESLTKECLRDGWFYTGDIGYMDKQGYLYICGRKKNLIVFSNGKKVVPEELELRLLEIPLIREVMVYGASNGEGTDEVTLSAMIYPEKSKTGDAGSYKVLMKIQEEIDKLNRKLPFYKRIQSIKISESEFGKSGLYKIKRGGGTV